METVAELTELQKAQILLEQEKRERAEIFQQELQELCKKHNCSLVQGHINIQAH